VIEMRPGGETTVVKPPSGASIVAPVEEWDEEEE
jgi:hypothetical protein